MGRWSRSDRLAHRGRRTIRRGTAVRRTRDRPDDAIRPRLPACASNAADARKRIDADAVILAAGGFEANPAWRARYLGPGWDLARVRGTRFNTGDGIRMALDVGAAARGHWSGCHAVGWDANAPEFGDLAVGDGFQKHSYPFGIMVNARGQRFVDEGADFRNYTYAKYGREILLQPGQIAWQIFDAKVTSLLRDEYRIRQVSRVTARIPSMRCRARSTASMRPQFCRNRSRIQCGRRSDDTVRPNAQGWPRHAWTRVAEVELGESVGHAAIRSVRGDVRHHVHVRRPARRRRRARHLRRRRRRFPVCSQPASWSAGCSTSTIRAAPGSRRARCSDAWPASAPVKKGKTNRVQPGQS